MINNKYIIKNLAPWMIDELLAFSETINFDIIFLREQDSFYNDAIKELESRNIRIFTKPESRKNLFKKVAICMNFILLNFFKFKFNYNAVLGIKSIWWFLKLDLDVFSKQSNIHSQFATQATLLSFLIKKYYNNEPKYSFTFHAHDIYFKNAWFNILVKNCYRCFSISEYNIEYINRKYEYSEKVRLARLGVFREDISKLEQKDEEHSMNFALGLMSRFVEKKGISYLLDSILELKQRGNHSIKLIFAGDGPLNKEIQDFIKKNNLKDTIQCLGRIKGDDKVNFYNTIDVFILPSIKIKNDQDGIPVVLMEAVAYGLPLISTNVSGIPEICVNDFNGLLIREKDSGAIIESILKLNKNKKKLNIFGNNSLLISDKYDIRLNSIEKIENLDW